TDDDDDNPEKPFESFVQPNTSHSKERHIREEQRAETDGHQRSSGQTQSSWPHWYRNEPYHPRRPRTDLDQSNQWHHPQTPTRPPNPRFHRPPFHPQPPLRPTFPNPQNPPSHVNQNQIGSRFTNQHPEDSHAPPFPGYPPPNVCSQTSQGFYRDAPHYFDKDERICSYDARSGNVSFDWSTDAKEEWCQFGGDYDWRQRNDSETEQWDRHSQHPDNTSAHHSSLVLILMRGLPGSGKSTLARELLSTGPSGLILSTDDYFAHRDGYHYEAGLLGAAHEWNQRRAEDAMHDRRSPIIIDNTNIQAWEMKPYVKLAMERGYKVDFCEPDTSWKFDPYELEKRNKHGVPHEKIAKMMDHFSFPISVDIVMRSQEPHHVNQRRQPEQPQMMRRNRDFS
ncbi:NEDD4-binding protein 2-like 2, partial [Labrus mixtus]|uniref:NEDD4-binding protein 2-like 2 n=1 Tax=Labrus mixtus TaxID=508554 RepID=UPI0029C096B8